MWIFNFDHVLCQDFAAFDTFSFTLNIIFIATSRIDTHNISPKIHGNFMETFIPLFWRRRSFCKGVVKDDMNRLIVDGYYLNLAIMGLCSIFARE